MRVAWIALVAPLLLAACGSDEDVVVVPESDEDAVVVDPDEGAMADPDEDAVVVDPD